MNQQDLQKQLDELRGGSAALGVLVVSLAHALPCSLPNKAFADFDSRVLAWRNQWDHPVKGKVKQAVLERDPAKREALYREIQKTVLDEGPYAIFAYPLRQIAMRVGVKGLDPSPLYQTYDFSNVTKE